MAPKGITLLHPGEMGAAVGACLREHGLRVLWVSGGRSAATRARARASALQDVARLEDALKASDIVLSICPPHAAVEVAASVAQTDDDTESRPACRSGRSNLRGRRDYWPAADVGAPNPTLPRGTFS